MKARTVAGVLRQRAEHDGDAPGLFHKADGGWVAWSWAQYWEKAVTAAAGLEASGVRRGHHVLMLVTDVEVAVANLFGVWALGAVPIQMGLPYRVTDMAAFTAQVQDTARRLSAKVLLVSQALLPQAVPTDSPVLTLAAESMLYADPAALRPDPESTRAPALIQLTSGSTGHPRAVVISQQALNDHLTHIGQALPIGGDDAAGLSWLPLHHDMGLIGGLLFPLFSGFPVHCMSPLDFRRNPFRWLSEISRVGATCSLGPPSAYAICLRLAGRAAEMQIDLSRWECAMIGAEPISPALLRRFADRFGECGFRRQAFFPVYGLAEATVAVTFPDLLQPTRFDRVDRSALEREGVASTCDDGHAAVELVGVGRPIPGCEIRIVAEDGTGLGPRRAGEIHVRSTSLMTEYYDDPETTAEVLADGWLRTGDLGYQADGELFVTGRKKDLIIKGGHNLLPSAIEEIVGDVDGIRSGCVAAVGVHSAEHETDQVFVVAETSLGRPDRTALEERVREALRTRGIAVDQVILARRSTLPRTTSGKIKRGDVARQLASPNAGDRYVNAGGC